jgi:ABC-2 family transporter protein
VIERPPALGVVIPARTPLLARTLRSLVLLTGMSIRRLLREGLVLRSMIWPGLVTCGTLAVTLIIFSAVRPARVVAVPLDADPAVVSALTSADFLVRPVRDVAASVAGCRPNLGTDGHHLHVCGTPPSALELEALLRTRLGAPWKPVAMRPPDPKTENLHGDLACRILALLFVLYGLVFGLGGVARDRDDGSLEAELSLPIPRFVGGLARWLASSAILAVFFSASVLGFSSLIAMEGTWDVVRHGIAASAVGVALGLSVVGTAGLKNGFSGPFAAAMSWATGLAVVGWSLDLWWLPIGSLFTADSGWTALGVALILGLGSGALYGHRVSS